MDNLHVDRVCTVLVTLGVVGVAWFVYWVVTRVQWLFGGAADLNERLTELEKSKRPGL